MVAEYDDREWSGVRKCLLIGEAPYEHLTLVNDSNWPAFKIRLLIDSFPFIRHNLNSVVKGDERP